MNKILVFSLLGAGLVISPSIFAESTLRWTLNSSIQRALDISPEMKSAEAEIGKQQGKLEQASAWPNPSVSLQLDDTLGLEDNSGGFDVTQISISQALPFGRLEPQRKQAEAGIASAIAQHRQQQLLLEYQVAEHLHLLQLSEAKLNLAKKRLRQAKAYQNKNPNGSHADVVIRYLSPLETMRLNIVLQAAKQTMEVAEGEFDEAAASFKAMLGLPVESSLNLLPLMVVPVPVKLSILKNSLQEHPALEASKQAIVYSQTGITVAKSQRFSDPRLMLSRGKDIYNNRRQQSTSIMLSIQVPLWNQNKGRVTQARYIAYQAKADLRLQERDLKTNLHKSYLHLGHLIKQAEHYRSKLLKPAKQVFRLTRKGFDAGELNILTLIDANNTYFNAQERYLELLQEGWLELAEVRKSAGLFVTNNAPITHFDEVKSL